ncbi:hypothetical protein BGZ63DRAFT_421676 [Mariannaea sp. PMI_226]|nr:hypothetical protein BGZ63DRAFT_421676 [Mariannaea sp. PMI_226]
MDEQGYPIAPPRRGRQAYASPVPSITYTSSNQFSHEQIETFHDICLEFLRARPIANKTFNSVPKPLLKSLFTKVFDRWDSKMTVREDIPTLRERNSADVTIQVGRFTCDLPVSIAKRKRGQSSGTEVVPDERRRGAPAFLAPCLNEGEECIRWMYKDSKGKLVNRKFVEFTNGFNDCTAKIAAVDRYDETERERIMGHNALVGITLARRRIKEFAKQDDPTEPFVHEKDKVSGLMQPLVLCRDVTIPMEATIIALNKHLDENGSDNANRSF